MSVIPPPAGGRSDARDPSGWAPPAGTPWAGPVIPLGEVDDGRRHPRRGAADGPPARATWTPPPGPPETAPSPPVPPPPGWVLGDAPSHTAGFWARPPGLVGPAILVPVAFPMLWWASFPGGRSTGVVAGLFGFAALVAAVVLAGWAVRTATFLVHAIRGRSAPRRAWVIALVPSMTLVLLLVAGTDMAFRIRWALGDDEFAALVADVGPGPSGEWQAVAVPDRVGHVDVAEAMTYGEVLFVRPLDADRDAWLVHARTSRIIPNGYQHEGRLRSLGDGWWLWTDD